VYVEEVGAQVQVEEAAQVQVEDLEAAPMSTPRKSVKRDVRNLTLKKKIT
jgi:hypothetical protein